MHEPINCRFCCLAAGLGETAVDTPLLESDSFVVLPSLGGFVEGWLLVVPRRHLLSMAQLTDRERVELRDLVGALSERVGRNHRGQVWRFEHGATSARQSIGCGVDHAHTHVVPLPFDLIPVLRSYDSSVVFNSIAADADFDGLLDPSTSYIFASNGYSAVCASHTEGESQFVRRAIAKAASIPTKWDWNSFPHLETVGRTIAALTSTDCHSLALK